MKLPWSYSFLFSSFFLWRLGRHVLFWFGRVMMCFIIGVPFVRAVELMELYSVSQLLYNYIHDIVLFDIPFTYITCYVLFNRYLIKEKYTYFGISLFVLTVLFSTGFVIYEFMQNRNIELSAGNPLTPFDLYFIFWKLKVFFTYTGVSFILFLSIKLYKLWYLKEKENQQLVLLNKEAKIEILQARIHPHFLFNSLNTIYSFAFYDQLKSKDMLKKLYTILHYMVYDCNGEYILLSKEIKAVEDYINLEKERYGDRLRLSVNQMGNFNGKQIAPLLLQPFVENAFKHGASKVISNPWIDITLQVLNEYLHFTITNGTPSHSNYTNSVGIGIENIKNRLSILYPNKYALNISQKDSSFIVKLEVPLH